MLVFIPMLISPLNNAIHLTELNDRNSLSDTDKGHEAFLKSVLQAMLFESWDTAQSLTL